MTTITTTSIATTTITTTTIPMLMTTSEPEPVDDRHGMTASEVAALYRLMTWLSPSFPVGAFAYSSGIEWAVEAGDITDAASLRDWLAAILADGSDFATACSWRRRTAQRWQAMTRACARLPNSPPPSCRRASVSSRPRRRAAPSSRSPAPPGTVRAWTRSLRPATGAIVYPIAVGIVSAAHQIPLEPALHAFFHAVVSNWISAGSRLIPLGQTDSQRVLADLEPVVASTAIRALDASLDDLGSATFRADLASLRHETQYTRLFRS